MNDTREKILTLAGELIQTKGYDSFTFKEIADRLGMRAASLYYHFPHKQDLGLAFLQYWSQVTLSISGQLDRSRMSPWEKLRSFLGIGYSAAQNQKVCPVSALQLDHLKFTEEMKQQLDQIELDELKLVTKILREGLESGEMQFPNDPEDQARLVLSAFKGALLYSLNRGEDFYQKTIAQIEATLLPTKDVTLN
jgi:TetR/AcrR family transcriptional repressor of nem operon